MSRLTYARLGGCKVRVVHPGNYTVRIRATSLAGNGSWSQPAFFFMADSEFGQTLFTEHTHTASGLITEAGAR